MTFGGNHGLHLKVILCGRMSRIAYTSVHRIQVSMCVTMQCLLPRTLIPLEVTFKTFFALLRVFDLLTLLLLKITNFTR